MATDHPPSGVAFRGLAERVAVLEEHVDMLQTPVWKRTVFWLNGWPFRPVAVLSSRQKRRPWHRWWGRRDGG